MFEKRSILDVWLNTPLVDRFMIYVYVWIYIYALMRICIHMWVYIVTDFEFSLTLSYRM